MLGGKGLHDMNGWGLPREMFLYNEISELQTESPRLIWHSSFRENFWFFVLFFSGETDLLRLWLLAWHNRKTRLPHPDDWEMACALSPQQHWGVWGCVSSILWELTFPLLFPRRNQQLLLPYVPVTRRANLQAISCQPGNKYVHQDYISITVLAI